MKEQTPRNTPKVFPLRVTQQWLDEIDEAKKKYQPKHDFVLEAVEFYKKYKKGNKI